MLNKQTGTFLDLYAFLIEEHNINSSTYKHEFIKVSYRYECGCVRYLFSKTLKGFESRIGGILEFDYCCHVDNDGRVWVYVEIEIDHMCESCEESISSLEDSDSSAFNHLLKAVHLVQSKGYSKKSNCPVCDVPSEIEYSIFNALVEYCKKSSNFHVDHEVNLVDDWEYGNWGAFRPSTFDVYVNDKLVYGLMKSLNLNITMLLKKLPVTVLHEHRHALQEYKHFPMVDVPYPDPEIDYEAYYNHPTEVDAREYAEEYAEEAMGYVVYVLRKEYLGHLYNK